MNSHTLNWATAIVMLLGGVVILLTGKRRTASEEMQTVLHGVVPLIAACSYFAMAIGQGSIILPADLTTGPGTTRIFYFARYIDWTFTTPLLLVSLTLTAMHAGQKRIGALTGIVLADLMMILTALFFGLSHEPWIKWTWFLISCIAFLGVYYVLWISNLQYNAAERSDVRSSYRRNASILSVLWLIYPVILAVAPDGLNVISDSLSVLAIALLDIVSKVAYGFLTVASDTRTTDLDLKTMQPTSNLRAA